MIRMTNKRFKVFTGKNYGIQSVDGEVIINSIISIGDADVLVDWLNDIYNENEQLEKELAEIETKLYKANDELFRQDDYFVIKEENEQLKQYKQSVSDVLLSWSQKSLSAKQLQVVIAIMEELNVMRDLE